MLILCPSWAQSWQIGQIRVSDSYARATVAKQSTGAVYLQLENLGKSADKLIQIQSSVADSAELHAMLMEQDVMKMRQLSDLIVPANGKVGMKPGLGAHVMLLGLKQPLQPGQEIPLTLTFEKAGQLDIKLKVRALR
jgi:copper(I)-binding protein